MRGPGLLSLRADVWGRVSLCCGGERSCALQHVCAPAHLASPRRMRSDRHPGCKNQKDVSGHRSLSPGTNGCPHVLRLRIQTLAGGLTKGDLVKRARLRAPWRTRGKARSPRGDSGCAGRAADGTAELVLRPHQRPVPTDAHSSLAAGSRSQFCFTPLRTALNLTQPELSCFAFPSAHRAQTFSLCCSESLCQPDRQGRPEAPCQPALGMPAAARVCRVPTAMDRVLILPRCTSHS